MIRVNGVFIRSRPMSFHRLGWPSRRRECSNSAAAFISAIERHDLQVLLAPRFLSPDTMQHGCMMPPHDAPDLRQRHAALVGQIHHELARIGDLAQSGRAENICIGDASAVCNNADQARQRLAHDISPRIGSFTNDPASRVGMPHSNSRLRTSSIDRTTAQR